MPVKKAIEVVYEIFNIREISATCPYCGVINVFVWNTEQLKEIEDCQSCHEGMTLNVREMDYV